MIPEEFVDFGIVETHPGRPHAFRVYSSPYEYVDVPYTGTLIDVRWSGNAIVAVFESHKRIYYGLGPTQYEIMYS